MAKHIVTLLGIVNNTLYIGPIGEDKILTRAELSSQDKLDLYQLGVPLYGSLEDFKHSLVSPEIYEIRNSQY